MKVTFFGEQTNLHSVWDSGIIDRRNLSYSDYADRLGRRIEPQEVVAWWQRAGRMIGESTKLRDPLYPKEASLSWDYAYRHLPTVELRLQQAGIRTAAYLTSFLGHEFFAPTDTRSVWVIFDGETRGTRPPNDSASLK